MKIRILLSISGLIALSPFLILSHISYAQATILNWQKGVSIDSRSSDDFGSNTFKQSVGEALAMGANSISLIIPYYQSTVTSSDIQPGWNTPTDQALISAIGYVHSLGMRVDLKPHLQILSDPAAWRATIDASDRDSWYAAYENMLNHYANIARNYQVEQITIGTELITMASSWLHSDNTNRWNKIIDDMRGIYSGALTYSGDWGLSGWTDEKDGIKFWDKLDFIGISAYLPLSDNPNYTIADLEQSWSNWDTSQLKTLSDTYHKSIIFSEIGYRSVDGAMIRPARWQTDGAVDLKEQADGFQSLFEYWSKVPYFNGVSIWGWSSDPNAGGSNDNGYSPQHKPAENLIKQWFTTATASTPVPRSEDIIIHAKDIDATNIHGNWKLVSIPDAADTIALSNPNLGIPKVNQVPNPKDYIDFVFNAQANTPYHLWMRMKAQNDSYENDSVSVQFSDVTDSNLINSSNAWHVILEDKTGAGEQNWGWNDNLYDGLGPNIIFTTPGAHMIRIQTREDGIMIDQIVLSPMTYINSSPGLLKNDSTILSATTTPTPTPSLSPTPTITPTPSPTPTPTPTATPAPTPTTNSNKLSLWWPTNGATLNGTQPFKGLLENWNVNQYSMYWQVDGDRLNAMSDSNIDWPHKESVVDLSGWNWSAQNVYHLNFIAKGLDGNIIAQQQIEIHINH
jgi:hypothetical protein